MTNFGVESEFAWLVDKPVPAQVALVAKSSISPDTLDKLVKIAAGMPSGQLHAYAALFDISAASQPAELLAEASTIV